ncbi:MAG: biotin transporter BioY [Eubacterium sp.]|nr:biotin transporter BioY [Eubacterium sp.]
MNSKVKTMTTTALITAVICILGPLAIPIGPVPISLGVLGILLGVYILGMWKGTLACLLYLLIGLVGLPVFSGFSGGAGKLLGPTGGYLIGYIPLALIAGCFIDRFYQNIPMQVFGMVLGIAVLYLFGTVWLAHQVDMSFKAALAAGVIPFIPFDLGKLVVSIILGRAVRNALVQAGILSQSGK